jgi:hypothetical protein
MVVRRVFIAWSHSLFYGSVRLLLEHPEIQIVGSSPAAETPWSEISHLHPDTIVVERTGDEGENEICPEEHLDWESGTRIIRVGLQDNNAQVCRCEQHTLEQAEDQLHLILTE